MLEEFIQAFQQAIDMILRCDSTLIEVIGRSLYVSGLGTLLACTWSIPIAVTLALYSFRGKWLVKSFFSALIGVPTVALGLTLVLLFSRQGPLGPLHLLFTSNGILVGQSILVTPIIVSFTSNALSNADVQVRDLARTLGANGFQTNLAVLRETAWSTVLAVTAAFSRAFGELGIAFMVGGNILHETRVLTTSIALESNWGNYPQAIAFAIILLAIVIFVTLIINLIERLRKEETTWTGWIIKRGTIGS
ncbi:MAG: ABC transporter permease [Candidatus Bathyarchaeota archaeon]|nr:ABC transporter permease [Candidatus Bathyarchaeota archaeon]